MAFLSHGDIFHNGGDRQKLCAHRACSGAPLLNISISLSLTHTGCMLNYKGHVCKEDKNKTVRNAVVWGIVGKVFLISTTFFTYFFRKTNIFGGGGVST